jgi:hypothetical protein
MEPIPASTRTSLVSTRSVRPADSSPPSGPTFPLTSLYIVSGLPKSPHTWTLADPDSITGLHHSEGAVNRWWRPEVLGSTLSPGAGGGTSKRRKKGKVEEGFSSAGYLNKQDVGKILSKSLKVYPFHIFILSLRLTFVVQALFHSRGRSSRVNLTAPFHYPQLYFHSPRTFSPSCPLSLYRCPSCIGPLNDNRPSQFSRHVPLLLY